ncbi:MAG: CRISPR-associated protein Cas7, partial [Bacteroidales bacterium]
MNPYIYLRALKHAAHTVFCVQDGQKTYFDPQFNRVVAYSSGQQVKRSILDALTSNLNVQMAPITFNYNVNAKKELENKEPWSPCDPTYIDQLLGGWMRAGDGITVKRRSPLSISAMRPI